jgi:hypothetical protein
LGRIVDQPWCRTDAEERDWFRDVWNWIPSSARALDAVIREFDQCGNLQPPIFVSRGDLMLPRNDLAAPSASPPWNRDPLGNWAGLIRDDRTRRTERFLVACWQT